MSEKESEKKEQAPSNFIRTFIDEDLQAGKNDGRVATRFPPEPNGYLHIGHAKSICLNFGIANDYNGTCNLRFDDTNPVKEEQRYVDAIKEDVRWLGFDWEEREYHASDYFDKLYEYAVQLIKAGNAFVCSLNAEQMREYRGTLTEPGKNSPDRNRSEEENLELFNKMKNGEFKDGQYTLRAKIDMASPNINMRDPSLYRIKKATHQRTGDTWCIYPMYDFAHALSDSIECITHSLCTLEFEDHRPLYEWFLEKLDVPSYPRQIEFARLNLSNTVMSKRKLLQLVEGGHVQGWDDPRMPTIAGFRRRGYTPEAIRDFCSRVGVAKADSVVDYGMLEFCIREDLNKRALRVMAVEDPIKLVISNYPEAEVEQLDAENNPEDESSGSRKIPFSRELYIERDDFMEDAPKKFFRLSPGREVRLKHAYYVTCDEVVKNDAGEIVELRCSYDPKTKGGWSDDGRKVKGTLHWVSAAHAVDVEVRHYEHLLKEDASSDDFLEDLNPDSLQVRTAKGEPSLAEAAPGQHFQFLRRGYFVADNEDYTENKPVFNRIVGLRDTWAKLKQK